MKITITGSLGNIGQHLVTKLVSQKHNVTVVSSSADRKTAIEAAGAQAAIGSITDTAFLTQAFTGADAVFVMTPPNMGATDIIRNTAEAGTHYAQAIRNTQVPRVVMLSSIGAELENGTGPIAGLHHIENLYAALENTTVTYLRAGYFYTNFYNDIPLIQNAGIMGSNFPAHTRLPLVHPKDIAQAAAEELQRTAKGSDIRYIVSSYVTATDVTAAFGKAIGKPELPWVVFTDEQAFEGMQQAGLNAEMAQLYTEMGAALRDGKLQHDFEQRNAPLDGTVTLADFAQEFARKL